MLAALKVRLYSCFPCRPQSRSPPDASNFASALLLICESSFVNRPRLHRISRTEHVPCPMQCRCAKEIILQAPKPRVCRVPRITPLPFSGFPFPRGHCGHLTTCEGSDAQAADATRAESPHPPSAVLSHRGALRARERGMSMHPCQLQGTHPQLSLPPTRADPSCPRRKQQADLPRRCYRVPAVPGPRSGQAALLTLPASHRASLPPLSLFPS